MTILAIFGLGGFYLWQGNAQTVIKPTLIQNNTADLFTPSPTPFPFQEMTIPYLRNRENEQSSSSNEHSSSSRKSSLGNLQRVSENQNYSSYLTSYTSEGLKINGQLTQPKGSPPAGGWPAIIFIHGYVPPRSYQTLVNYSSYVDYLARNNFVVFKIDLRGHGSSEGEPGGAYFSEDYIIDTLNAYAALQSSGFVNPQKIGLWGHSMAGNVVLRSMAAKPEIPAGVVWAGAVYTYIDFQEYRINDDSYRSPDMDSERVRKRREMLALYGEPSFESEFWRMVAPTNYLNDLKGAIQIHHALNDEVVDIRYSKNLNNLLDQTSVPHELHEYQSGGHNFTGSTFTQAMQKTVEFFGRYLR